MFEKTANVNHAIAELQGKQTTVLTGTTAATDIALAGAGVKDTIGSVIMFTAGVPSDVTSEASISSAGNLRLSTTNSTGNKLLVEWYPTVNSAGI